MLFPPKRFTFSYTLPHQMSNYLCALGRRSTGIIDRKIFLTCGDNSSFLLRSLLDVSWLAGFGMIRRPSLH